MASNRAVRTPCDAIVATAAREPGAGEPSGDGAATGAVTSPEATPGFSFWRPGLVVAKATFAVAAHHYHRCEPARPLRLQPGS